MLEALLSGGTGGGYYPHSGPGPKKLLAGTEAFGFFGVVDDSVLNDASDLIFNTLKAIDSAQAVSKYDSIRWYKYFFRNKVVYLPSKPLFYGFHAHHVAKGGMLFGNDKTAVLNTAQFYPMYSAPQNFRILAKDSNSELRSLKVRGLLNNSGKPETGNELTSETHLLINTHLGYFKQNEVAVFPGFQPAPLINGESAVLVMATTNGDISPTQIGMNAVYLCNVPASSPNTPIGFSYRLDATVATPMHWRPVLELETNLDPTYKVLYPISSVDGKGDTKLISQPASVEIDSGLQQIVVTGATGVNTLAFQNMEVATEAPSTVSFVGTKYEIMLSQVPDIESVQAANINAVGEKVIHTAQPATVETLPDPYVFAAQALAVPVNITPQLESAFIFNPYLKTAFSDKPAVTATIDKV